MLTFRQPASVAVPWMVGLFQVGFDFLQAEIGRLELLPGVELRLVEVMWRRRIGILAKHQDGSRLGLIAKIHHADKGVTGDTVTALLAFFRTRVEVEDDA